MTSRPLCDLIQFKPCWLFFFQRFRRGGWHLLLLQRNHSPIPFLSHRHIKAGLASHTSCSLTQFAVQLSISIWPLWITEFCWHHSCLNTTGHERMRKFHGIFYLFHWSLLGKWIDSQVVRLLCVFRRCSCGLVLWPTSFSFSHHLASEEKSEIAHCLLDTHHGFTLERNRAKAVERNWEGRAQEGRDIRRPWVLWRSMWRNEFSRPLWPKIQYAIELCCKSHLAVLPPRRRRLAARTDPWLFSFQAHRTPCCFSALNETLSSWPKTCFYWIHK